MSTVFESSEVVESAGAVQTLREGFVAIRLGFSMWGTKKTLSKEQKRRASEVFDANSDSLSASKKLIDTGCAEWKAITSKVGEIKAYFKGVSLPFPESAVRLIRSDMLDDVESQLREFQEQLQALVRAMDYVLYDLRERARRDLGSLFCELDYPTTLANEIGFDWDFPSVEPPEYLQRLNPRIYQEQSARVRARFQEAVDLAESAFVAELEAMLSHITETLTGAQDGKPKVFRDTMVGNFQEFFARFEMLNIGSSGELESIVEQARQILAGGGRAITPDRLRSSRELRSVVALQMGRVRESLGEMVENRPRRNIDRSQVRREDFIA